MCGNLTETIEINQGLSCSYRIFVKATLAASAANSNRPEKNRAIRIGVNVTTTSRTGRKGYRVAGNHRKSLQ
jgi:hypothetical protein